MHSTRKSQAACTLPAPPALTAHTATWAPPCAPHLPSRALPSPGLPLQGVSLPHPTPPHPRSPPLPAPLQCLTPPCLAAAPADPRRGEGRSALPPRQTGPEPPDGPHLKPAASPVPRPLGGASVLTLATARVPGGFTCRGGAPGTGAKVCARLGPSGLPSGGRARGARTGRRERRLRAAPGRARAGRGGTPRGGRRRRERAGKVASEPPGAAGASLPGSPPFPVAPRGCPGRGGARALPARHAGPREALRGSARSGSRAAGGGEINNARKRKTDVSLARASPASRPGLRSRPRSPPPPPAPLQ